MSEIEVPQVVTSTGNINANFDSLNKEIDATLKRYENLVYTDDDIPVAKKDRAYLNSQKKLLDDRRKEVKKEYSAPLVEFENKVKEVTSKIDNVSAKIDAQIKEVENRQKEEKLSLIEDYWNMQDVSNVFKFDKIAKNNWSNKTCEEDEWKSDIAMITKEINSNIAIINEIGDTSKRDYVMNNYIRSMDITSSLADYHAMEEASKVVQSVTKKAEQVEPVIDEMMERKFLVRCSRENLILLSDFMNKNGIHFEKI